eukprot:3640298-Pyramimonas_sp.AAC.2
MLDAVPPRPPSGTSPPDSRTEAPAPAIRPHAARASCLSSPVYRRPRIVGPLDYKRQAALSLVWAIRTRGSERSSTTIHARVAL